MNKNIKYYKVSMFIVIERILTVETRVCVRILEVVGTIVGLEFW